MCTTLFLCPFLSLFGFYHFIGQKGTVHKIVRNHYCSMQKVKTKVVVTRSYGGVVYCIHVLVAVSSCWYYHCPESRYLPEAFCCQADPLWRRNTRTETAEGEFFVVYFPSSSISFQFLYCFQTPLQKCCMVVVGAILINWLINRHVLLLIIIFA